MTSPTRDEWAWLNQILINNLPTQNCRAVCEHRMEKEALLLVIFVVLVTFGTANRGDDDRRKTIYLLTLAPYPNPTASLSPSWDGGPDIVPALRLAVEHVNNRTDVLDSYNLELIYEDGGCNIASTSVASFVRGLLEREDGQIVGIIGPGCSSSSLLVAPLLARDELSLINIHTAGSPLLENRTMYRNSFGTLGSAYGFVECSFALMRQNNWTTVNVLYDESRAYFYNTYVEFEKDITEAVPGSRIVFSAAVYESYLPLKVIEDTNARIVIVVAGPELARRIMCLAHHRDMLYPLYQWLIVSRTLGELSDSDVEFNYEGRAYSCSKAVMLASALNGNLLINYKLISFDENSITTAGISYKDYIEMYEHKVTEYNDNKENPYRNSTVSVWAAPYYDAVWGMVLALNKTNLTGYQFGDTAITDNIRKHLYTNEFEGVSGRVSFDSQTGNIDRVIDIFQVFNSTDEYVAYYNAGYIEKLRSSVFIDDKIEERLVAVSPYLAGFISIILLVQTALLITAQVLTVVYRKYPSIKATSPKLNHFAFIGCYIFIAGALLYTTYRGIRLLDSNIRGGFCHAIWSWLFPIGYTLLFATIGVRTWRLYRIFTHYLDPGKFISNPVLFTFVLGLVSVDVIIGITWSVVDPLKVRITRTTVTEDGVRNFVLQRDCFCDYYYYWLVTIMGFKMLTLLVVIVLALLTRNIPNKNFATNSLRVFVYLLGIVLTLGFSLYYLTLFFLSTSVYADYIVLCVLLNVTLFLTLSLVFIPPLLPLLREKWKQIYKTKTLVMTKRSSL